MRMMRTLATAITALTLSTGLLAACGGPEDTPENAEGAASAEHNQADVDFATDMIQHHAQALEMVDLSMGRDLDPEVAELTEQIRDAQAPEIEQMTDWLTTWGEPVPETSRDHAHAHGEGGEMDADMPGMMSGEDMTALEESSDADFQAMWLEMMIEHHEGAVAMAEEQLASGQHEGALALAEDVISAQEAEISTMRTLLEG